MDFMRRKIKILDLTKEEPPAAQLGEDMTPMGKAFQEKPKYRLPELLPWLKEQLKVSDTPKTVLFVPSPRGRE